MTVLFSLLCLPSSKLMRCRFHFSIMIQITGEGNWHAICSTINFIALHYNLKFGALVFFFFTLFFSQSKSVRLLHLSKKYQMFQAYQFCRIQDQRVYTTKIISNLRDFILIIYQILIEGGLPRLRQRVVMLLLWATRLLKWRFFFRMSA